MRPLEDALRAHGIRLIMTHYHIPFAYSTTDQDLVSSLYSEAAGCRITLQSVLKSGSQPRLKQKLWVDAGVDGLHSPKIKQPDYSLNREYKAYIRRFTNYDRVADPDFQRRPDRKVTIEFVAMMLDQIIRTVPNPGWISVPQLPYVDGADRNKVNRLLAEATLRWKSRSASSYGGKLMLPVILAKPGQTDRKTDRNTKVDLAFECFEASGANGVWIVDSTLDDQEGVGSHETDRFPGLIKFQEELNSKLPAEALTVAGPYWGLNLILWARGLVRLPAIGVGKSYQYHIAGGMQRKPVTRVALPPLRRLVVWSPELKPWLEEALRTVTKNDSAYDDFSKLLGSFQSLSRGNNAIRQVAQFYHDWLGKFESVSASSRALSMYQDLSAAYVLGMGLKPLHWERKVKSPARIAKQLMVNCL